MLARYNLINEQQGEGIHAMNFSALLNNAVYGIGLNIKQHVIATQKELGILRHCSTLLQSHPNHCVHIISSQESKHVSYFAKTLIHHGVSSGRIKLTEPAVFDAVPGGLWLVVAEG